MGDLPQINRAGKAPCTIRIQPHWKDHHFQGRPVLPAVEAMQLLAVRVQHTNPEIGVRHISRARFPKFLEIDPGGESLEVFEDLGVTQAGDLQAALITKTTRGTARITRSNVHAEIHFTSPDVSPPCFPLDTAAALEGLCHTIDPDTIYRELVPFGPRFRSICRPLVLSSAGALARVRTPDPSCAASGPLGSPFPLDGAFHAACVWGQCFTGVVAFPVGFESRTVFEPTTFDEAYTAHVVPVQATPKQLVFDIRLLDAKGRIRETVLGVDMRDVSRGTWRPPSWVVEKASQPALDGWRNYCREVVLLERAHLAPFAPAALSKAEAQRLEKMGTKRQNAYISARLACKRLWRRLAGNDLQTSAVDIETIVPEQPQPHLPPIQGQPFTCCSVSHDRRFCIAVAHSRPVGVDVERISSRALRARHLFMQNSEQTLLGSVKMDKAHAALRIWSIKEAAAKALDLNLAHAWEQIEVVALGEEESRLQFGGERKATAIHANVDGHLFTLVTGLE